MLRHRNLWLLLALLSVTPAARAADWPQWLGPDRNGISPDTGLLKEWPKGGPPQKWKATGLGGEAYAAPSIANGRVYLITNVSGSEYVTALDEKDGSKVWSVKIGKVGPNPAGGNNYAGPRSTPTVDGEKLYALCSGGELVCLELTKGDKVWAKDLKADFAGKPGQWAYAESPLVDGDTIVVTPGGKTATVVALNKKDGALIWKSAIGDTAAYGSTIKAEVGGVKQYVCFLSKGVVGVAAEGGKLLWRYGDPASRNGINIATPVFHDGLVFGCAGYGTGGGAARLTAANDKVTAKQAWFEDRLASQIGGFLCIGNHLYGVGGDGKSGSLYCVDFASGKIAWSKASIGAGSLCSADGLLYVRAQETGTVVLAEATSSGYKEHGRLSQPNRSAKKAWPYPVIANGCLYLRDQGVLLCYDVRDPKK
jgi:outer membrane protein assembly factor BamB